MANKWNSKDMISARDQIRTEEIAGKKIEIVVNRSIEPTYWVLIDGVEYWRGCGPATADDKFVEAKSWLALGQSTKQILDAFGLEA